MAVNKKGMRKVNYKGRQYLWRVDESDVQIPETGGFVEHRKERVLHIIASNKKFIVHYRIPEEGDSNTILRVEGAQFPRDPAAKEVVVPRWKHDSKRYPTADFVRRLIGWCMTKSSDE